MQATKLAKILNTFLDEEWNRFGHFLELPYLGVRKKQKMLYAYIKAYNFRKKKEPGKKSILYPSRDKLCKKFFSPQQCKNFGLLNKHLSALHQHAREFLALEEARNNPQKLELLSIQKALETNQHHYAELAIHRIWKTMTQETGDWHLRYCFVGKMDLLYFQLRDGRRKKSLLLKDESLDDYYLILRLRNYCLQLIHQYLDKNFQIPSYQKSFEAYIEVYRNRKTYTPAIFRAYYYLFKIFTQQEEELSLEKIKAIFMEEQHKIPDDSLNEIQNFLLNHLSLLIRKHQKQPAELLSIYQVLLHADTLREKHDNYILTLRYKSIVTLAVQSKAYQWLKTELIDLFINMVNPDDQETASNHALSEYYLGIGDWKQAFDLAFNISSYDNSFKFSRGTLLIRSAYELEQSDLIETLSDEEKNKYDYHRQIENFASQIRNNQTLSETVKKRYMNFVNFNRKLYHLENAGPNPEHISIILIELNQETNVANKTWLVQKFEQYVP